MCSSSLYEYDYIKRLCHAKDNTYFNLTFCPNNIAKEMKILFMENFILFIYGEFYNLYDNFFYGSIQQTK